MAAFHNEILIDASADEVWAVVAAAGAASFDLKALAGRHEGRLAARLELLEQRLRELQDQQQQVQTLRGEYRHSEALQLLDVMTAESHPRFASIREWARDREPGLRVELGALEERRDAADRAGAGG